jgi:hypothetical protein
LIEENVKGRGRCLPGKLVERPEPIGYHRLASEARAQP